MSPDMRAGHRASSASGLLVSILGGALPSMLATCSFARTMNPTHNRHHSWDWGHSNDTEIPVMVRDVGQGSGQWVTVVERTVSF